MSHLGFVWILFGMIYATQGQNSISIDSLHVESEIRHRYAVTLVTSQVTNMADFAQDVQFEVQLPKEAFITDFSMLIDGVVYPGEIAEKEAAAKRFQQAVLSGQSAGLVTAKSARETNDFVVSVNVEASNHVTFNLTYQELLQRRMGLYEHVIYINPGVIVPDFSVEVFINESREITELTVPEVRGDRLTGSVITASNRFAQIDSISASAARVTFAPTTAQQQEYSDRGVAGQFIVNYDVNHDVTPEGEILVSNGYFVHFFAPESLPPLGKRIVFVLDRSGSMGGNKIRQLREALIFILSELRPIDEFGIVLFNGKVQTWGSVALIPASPENVRRAKTFAATITAGGGTNINDALVWGLKALVQHPTKPSMLLFLTDGQASSGETNPTNILRNVAEVRFRRQSIYSLAFGRGADFGLIQKVSAQNKGFARRIYEDADASLQLAGFYNEISTPVLSEVFISYLNDSVDPDSLTVTDYPYFFRGSEIIVCGRFTNNSASGSEPTGPLSVLIEGIQNSSNLFLKRDVTVRRFTCCYPPILPRPRPTPKPGPIQDRNDFIERLWVYLTIKQLIQKTLQEAESTSQTVTSAKAKILELSLKYNFVTPYTSMVVTSKEKTVSTFKSDQANLRADRTPAGQSSGTQSISSRLLRKTAPVGLSSFPGAPIHTTTTTTPTLPPTLFPPPKSPDSPGYFASGLNVEVNVTSTAGRATPAILCLDVASGSSADSPQILLINDTQNGILLSALLHSSDYGIYRKFSQVQLRLNDAIDIIVSTKSIVIGTKTYRWWQLTSLSFDGLKITAKDGIELTTASKVVMTFHKFGLETRRSLASPFMTVTVTNTNNLSPSATGSLVSVVDLEDVQQTDPDSLSYVIGSTNQGQQDTFVSVDKTLEEKPCLRLHAPADLSAILGI